VLSSLRRASILVRGPCTRSDPINTYSSEYIGLHQISSARWWHCQLFAIRCSTTLHQLGTGSTGMEGLGATVRTCPAAVSYRLFVATEPNRGLYAFACLAVQGNKCWRPFRWIDLTSTKRVSFQTYSNRARSQRLYILILLKCKRIIQ